MRAVKIIKLNTSSLRGVRPEGTGSELRRRGGVPWRRARAAEGTRALFAFEKLSVCWPLGSLRFASILAAASTAFLTTQ